MKTIIYFKEDTQELKQLPITEENCYYIGNFTQRQIKLIEKFLETNHVSFRTLYNYKISKILHTSCLKYMLNM
jgi:hypothetical protein